MDPLYFLLRDTSPFQPSVLAFYYELRKRWNTCLTRACQCACLAYTYNHSYKQLIEDVISDQAKAICPETKGEYLQILRIQADSYLHDFLRLQEIDVKIVALAHEVLLQVPDSVGLIQSLFDPSIPKAKPLKKHLSDAFRQGLVPFFLERPVLVTMLLEYLDLTWLQEEKHTCLLLSKSTLSKELQHTETKTTATSVPPALSCLSQGSFAMGISTRRYKRFNVKSGKIRRKGPGRPELVAGHRTEGLGRPIESQAGDVFTGCLQEE